ncbi:MAG: hypothetical protein HUK15_04640 [Bacteroidales bacterium]|nr:hypothetical protein [Bacteroidales bacterium]
MAVNSSYNAMIAIVKKAKGGKIFFPDDFVSCGTPDAVRSGLSRMCSEGILWRIAKGIYSKPQCDKWDGTPRKPSLDKIAHSIAQRDKARIAPTGAYALNKLGLSTQVPTNIIYITDGSARQVKFEEGNSITFKHSNELRNFAYQSSVMQFVVTAMREIGENALTEEQLTEIKRIITESVSEKDFKHDIVLAPTWVKTLLQK